MDADPKSALLVGLCNWLIRALSRIVPRQDREHWRRERLAEIWHRWRFLAYTGEWNRHEAWGLIRNALGAIPDALARFVGQEKFQSTVRRTPRSPWTCIGSLCGGLAVAGLLSSGFPATREVWTAETGATNRNIVCIWLHPVVGGTDRWLPSDVVSAWATHSKLLKAIAPFMIERGTITYSGTRAGTHTFVITNGDLFRVFAVHPELGEFPRAGTAGTPHATSDAVLDHRTWVSMFHGDKRAIGSTVVVNGSEYRIAAVLPSSFHFLSREPAIYLLQSQILAPRVMAIARTGPGVTITQLDRELINIAENVTYYFFRSQLRIVFYHHAVLAPISSFGAAVFASMLIAFTVWRARFRHVRRAISAQNRAATLRRGVFFLAKTALALALVFTATLECSRSESAVLFASLDPASGPFILWIYVLAVMGAMFWSLADQRARCRVCLRLMCFPVRMGCPGCVLLNWSGTELLCSEGHGVLHVPQLPPSWDEESEHWIALDESWQGLFTSLQ